MTDYSKYTDEELEQAKSSIKQTIFCHECGNDSYYLSQDYKSDHAILFAIESEIKFREDSRTVSELTTDIMKGFFGC